LSAEDLGARVAALETTTEMHDRQIFGTWITNPATGEKDRVPGMLEQIDATLKTLKRRDEDEQKRVIEFRNAAWSVARPLIVLIVLLIVLDVARWIIENGTVLTKGVHP
jgi:hypothetical protein